MIRSAAGCKTLCASRAGRSGKIRIAFSYHLFTNLHFKRLSKEGRFLKVAIAKKSGQSKT
jgi:hypothetical protein